MRKPDIQRERLAAYRASFRADGIFVTVTYTEKSAETLVRVKAWDDGVQVAKRLERTVLLGALREQVIAACSDPKTEHGATFIFLFNHAAVERAVEAFFKEEASPSPRMAAVRFGNARAKARGRANGGMPKGFDGFDLFGDEAPAFDEAKHRRDYPLAGLKRGDVFLLKKTRFVVWRPVGSYQAYVYKKGVKKPFEASQTNDGRIEIRAFEGNSVGATVAMSAKISDVTITGERIERDDLRGATQGTRGAR